MEDSPPDYLGGATWVHRKRIASVPGAFTEATGGTACFLSSWAQEPIDKLARERIPPLQKKNPSLVLSLASPDPFSSFVS